MGRDLTDARLAPLRRYLADRADRPLGDVELVNGRTLQPFSQASSQAASNLLEKAVRALVENQDEPRARALVERAARLPWDPHEEQHPAAAGASMLLFGDITDRLEESDTDDATWLGAAAGAGRDADDAARTELRCILTGIAQDFELTSSELKTIKALIATLPPGIELRDRDLEGSALVDAVMSVVALSAAYRGYGAPAQ